MNQCVVHIMDNYAEILFDMGPRQTIKAMVRKIRPSLAKTSMSVDV